MPKSENGNSARTGLFLKTQQSNDPSNSAVVPIRLPPFKVKGHSTVETQAVKLPLTKLTGLGDERLMPKMPKSEIENADDTGLFQKIIEFPTAAHNGIAHISEPGSI